MVAAGGGHIVSVEQVEADSKNEAIKIALQELMDEEADVYNDGGYTEMGHIGVVVRDIKNHISKVYGITKVESEDEYRQGQRKSS